MNYSAIVVAAGKSSRYKSDKNKLLEQFSDGTTVLTKTLSLFRNDKDCKQIIVVVSNDTLQEACKNPNGTELYCLGGDSRSESVYHGLMAVNQPFVLVHDGARCYLNKEDLQQLKMQINENQGALLVGNEVDTIKEVQDGFVVRTIDRDCLKRAQTPQGFPSEELLEAYHKAMRDNFVATDDCSIIENYSDLKIKCVISKYKNEKITVVTDFREG